MREETRYSIWIRNNIVGLVAILALCGSALASNAGGEHSSKASKASASKKGPRGPAGPTGAQGPQGVQGVAGTSGLGGPPNGSAGGDLSGSYPSPTIATGAITGGVGGKVADDSLTSADIADALTLGYLGASTLVIDDLTSSSNITVGGDFGVNGPNVLLPPNSVDGAEIDESTLSVQRQAERSVASPAATLNAAGVSVIQTNFQNPTTITDLTGGTAGQIIVIVHGGTTGSVTLNDSGCCGALLLASNWTATGGDTLTLVRSGTRWVEMDRSDN
jgi:hypothetical protein